MIVKKRIYLW